MKTTSERFGIILLILLIFVFFYIRFSPTELLPVHFMSQFMVREGLGISSVPVTNQEQMLSQYMIMGAYNAPFDGTAMTLEQLKTVLNYGCRFIDLEIRSYTGIPIIAYSPDGTTITSDTPVLYLNKVLDAIAMTAFSSVPNNGDPLFIRFRFSINEPKLTPSEFYDRCADIIVDSLGPLLFTENIGAITKLSDIMGKVIIVVDDSLVENFMQSCKTKPCVFLKNHVNITIGGKTWMSMDYKNVTGMPSIANADNGSIMMPQNRIPMLQIVVPPTTSAQKNTAQNPSPCDLYYYVNRCTCQTVLYMFYVKDTGNKELQNYQKLFVNQSAAFVPMGYAMKYLQQQASSYKANNSNYNCSKVSDSASASFPSS